ncbi:acetyl-CoA carboxylase-like isoform X3 [Convolutriloba macropyga]|uniref:acetyl-CoA carboxylase-like isoform X3 n=1 Tax=Convolutriloba macropyga TaxID=536237 RepID=UPI003F5227A7
MPSRSKRSSNSKSSSHNRQSQSGRNSSINQSPPVQENESTSFCTAYTISETSTSQETEKSESSSFYTASSDQSQSQSPSVLSGANYETSSNNSKEVQLDLLGNCLNSSSQMGDKLENSAVRSCQSSSSGPVESGRVQFMLGDTESAGENAGSATEDTPQQPRQHELPLATSSGIHGPVKRTSSSALQNSPLKHSWSNLSSKDLTAATPQELVSKLGGSVVIEKILIANNGIAAVKCMRSIRRWSYEMFRNERAIKFVVMATPEDLEANAEYIKLADNYILVPGGSNNNNYANVELILDIARRQMVQAVWAGWGHASENPKLPELLTQHGIAFLGPNAGAMHALGDKIASSIVAQTVGVPTLPWSGSHIKLKKDILDKGEKLVISDEMIDEGAVQTPEQGLQAAERIGFPVMIKASGGGGGKGIRKVEAREDFVNRFRAVQSEFPGSPVFIMKMATNTRHIEVQIIADKHGNAISLFSRDCSIQRRHQKIIEEAPAVVAEPEVFMEMERAAVALAKAVGYVNAGTVEYLYTSEGFYFLELNPRLQVEHPCTEMVADVNLPALQLQVAMGISLHRIKDIRLLYREHPYNDTPIDFDNPVVYPQPKGHVIACRITSENPDEGFKPNSGSLNELSFKSSKHVWGYFSVSGSGGVHQFADSQFGHCFAYGDTRNDAISNMVMALKELSIRGDFSTTVDYLITLLQTDDFIENLFDTSWLDNRIANNVTAAKPALMPALVATAVLIADDEIMNNHSHYRSCLERGQVLPPANLDAYKCVELIHDSTKYKIEVTLLNPSEYILQLNDSSTVVRFHRLNDGGLLLSLEDNTSYTAYMKETVDSYRLQLNNQTITFEKENDPTLLRAPSAGKLVEFLVEENDKIQVGTPYATIEVMKMLMTLTCNIAGKIRFIKRPGAIIAPGMLIAEIEMDNSGSFNQATVYDGGFGIANPQPRHITSAKPNEVYKQTVRSLEYILDGYCMPEPMFTDHYSKLLTKLVKSLRDPTLPLLEMQDVLNTMSGRLNAGLDMAIRRELQKYASNLTAAVCQFPTNKIVNMIDEFMATSIKNKADRDLFVQNTQPLVQTATKFREGLRGNAVATFTALFVRYLSVEENFQIYHLEKSVKQMRESDKSTDLVMGYIRAHVQVQRRNQVVIALFESFAKNFHHLVLKLKPVFTRFTELNQPVNNKVALKARKALISLYQPSYDSRKNTLESVFLRVLDSASFIDKVATTELYDLINQDMAIFDVLPEFFFHPNIQIAFLALEVYIRRSYIAYEVQSMTHETLDDTIPMSVFEFSLPKFHPNRHRMFRSPSIVNETFFPESDSTGENNIYDRVGVMSAFQSIDVMKKYVSRVIQAFPDRDNEFMLFSSAAPLFRDVQRHTKPREPIHILNFMVREQEEVTDNELSQILHRICSENLKMFVEHNVRRCTFMVFPRTPKSMDYPARFFTFRSSSILEYEKAFNLHKCGSDPSLNEVTFGEDTLYRHLEPAMAFQLEIHRMRNYDLKILPSNNLRLHIYLASAKNSTGSKDCRFFLRAIVRHTSLKTSASATEYLKSEAEKLLLEALDELELHCHNSDNPKTDCNHIFFNFVPTVLIDPAFVESYVREMIEKFGLRLWRRRVLCAELKFMIRPNEDTEAIPIRVTVDNESGFVLKLHTYRERLDKTTGNIVFQSWAKNDTGPLEGMSIGTAYLTKNHLQAKRFAAQTHGPGTTYVYDYPTVLQQILLQRWDDYKKQHKNVGIPKTVLKCQELVLNSENELVSINRNPAENTIGMVAWRMTLLTPECPLGREIIFIANDITFQLGSFGVAEDNLFKKASELSRALKIPRLYVSANSGARIGLANEVKALFKIAWEDEKRPERGFKYIYLTPGDFKKISSDNSIATELIEDNGESRYKITAIIGKDPGLGVENLQGSGLIAGETSQAYQDVVTYSIVTCRAIGIGSYLVRLGQRVIQVDNSNIILTGYAALNKLLGREVYSDNSQLGGTQVMHFNGVSHCTADNDHEALKKFVLWLSFVPAAKGEDPPILPVVDPIDREIDFMPSKQPYDPRHMLAGKYNQDGSFWTGFFDVGSFDEIMAPWAPTVVTGRARLGGMPIGVIAVETRTVDVETPADPANPTSEAKIQSQAGQVWYPDSAYKTAQAIKDFNHEELPIMVFANWRGFSGGMKDMFDQVLKFGSYIVDELRQCTQPVLIYIPPYAELRGGAWVVIDPFINYQVMEMYADTNSRGGVLEPEGTVEIKFKLKEIKQTMRRLDDTYRKLQDQLGNPDLTPEQKADIESKIKRREEVLGSVYHSIAVHFADLHDTPTRMMKKDVINDIVDWKTSRKFFYWRFKRLSLKNVFYRRIVHRPISRKQFGSMMQRWFLEAKGALNISSWTNDEEVAKWLQEEIEQEANTGTCQISRNLQDIRHHSIVHKVKEILEVEQPKPQNSCTFDLLPAELSDASGAVTASAPIDIKRISVRRNSGSGQLSIPSPGANLISPEVCNGKFYDLVEDAVGQLLEFLPPNRRARFQGPVASKSLDEVEEEVAETNTAV